MIDMTERDLLKYLATHFIVKTGRNHEASQYGHLELWWAAKSVDDEPDAARNPMMLIGSAYNSFGLAAMAELQSVINAAREMIR